MILMKLWRISGLQERTMSTFILALGGEIFHDLALEWNPRITKFADSDFQETSDMVVKHWQGGFNCRIWAFTLCFK